MPTSKEFRAARVRVLEIEALVSDWKRVSGLIYDNRLDDALEIARATAGKCDDLKDAYTLTHYPVCEGCHGLSEREDPANPQGRKLCCYLGGEAMCVGNKYGRMHPAQMVEFIEALIAGKTRPAPPLVDPAPLAAGEVPRQPTDRELDASR